MTNAVYYTTLPSLDNYFQPKTIEEVVSLLTSYGKEAKVLAGGTDLVVLMRNRNLIPKCIIDITRIPGLDYVIYNKDGLRIGALATLNAVVLSPAVKKNFLSLHQATSQMATPLIRKMATIIGNLCRASPAADTAPPLLVLQARVKIAGPAGFRVVPLEHFFTGPGKTVLEYNEMVTEIQIPKLPPYTGTAFLRITRVDADLAKVNVATAVTIKDGNFKDVRIALGGVAPTPIRASKAEQFLKGSKLDDKLIEMAAQTAAKEIKPITDIRSTREYRAKITIVLVRKALNISLEIVKGVS